MFGCKAARPLKNGSIASAHSAGPCSHEEKPLQRIRCYERLFASKLTRYFPIETTCFDRDNARPPPLARVPTGRRFAILNASFLRRIKATLGRVFAVLALAARTLRACYGIAWAIRFARAAWSQPPVSPLVRLTGPPAMHAWACPADLPVDQVLSQVSASGKCSRFYGEICQFPWAKFVPVKLGVCLLYTSPSPRD